MTAEIANPRFLDHLVLPTADIAMARKRLSQLGFVVASDAVHPFGTENACVYFADKTFLEPLGIASREDCEATARDGNVFTARDQAYRFRRGQEGFSALVMRTDNAEADHARFVAAGQSAGPMLEFSRPMRFPDGHEVKASFKLAFAADLRAPDMFFFTCQRINVVAADRSALEVHDNGVKAIAEVVLFEPNPTDFQYLLQQVVSDRRVNAHSFGMEIETANAKITVLNAAGMQAFYDEKVGCHARGLRGKAVVFSVDNLSRTESLLQRNNIAYQKKDNRLLVPQAPGQGALFVFGEKK
jgi:catechol 2,3-dioxygenase-like lactoylglutathione lyase family enzyme